MMYYFSFWPFHFVGLILEIVFWAFIILLILRLTRVGGRHERSIEILKERYAKGEITKEQFEQMKRDLL